MKRLEALGVILALAVGCSPNLNGAACLTDCNCPSAQRCARNPDGGNGMCGDGANYCGKDAGPALFGTLTLNGGVAKPSGNSASVLAWDHSPMAIGDGGYEAPLHSAPVNSDGTWEIDQGVLGSHYYLTGVYALNAGRLVSSLPAATTANGFSVDVDVPTYYCLVWSELPSVGPGMSASLAGLVADVPNITDGTELSTATVKASDGTHPTFELALTAHPADPFADGKWAWGPASPGDTKAIDGTYTFTIAAMGYGSGTKCSVNNTSLDAVPVLSMFQNPWDTTQAQAIVFTPPANAQVTYISILQPNGASVPLPTGVAQVSHGTNSPAVTVTVPANQLGAICPENGPQCVLTLLSVRQTFTGNTGLDEATSSTSSAFNTKTN